jgi:hypothetical protein
VLVSGASLWLLKWRLDHAPKAAAIQLDFAKRLEAKRSWELIASRDEAVVEQGLALSKSLFPDYSPMPVQALPERIQQPLRARGHRKDWFVNKDLSPEEYVAWNSRFARANLDSKRGPGRPTRAR